jgi:PIN domain nuclease of toxin-antitoxin system
VILLDTNALLWLEAGHPRARPLTKLKSARLYVSPASLLEVQFLAELGRIKLKGVALARELARDARWTVDEPPAGAWFDEAHALAWTRDPFDRLIAAHALARRWRLATSDAKLVEHLDRRWTLEL